MLTDTAALQMTIYNKMAHAKENTKHCNMLNNYVQVLMTLEKKTYIYSHYDSMSA